MKHITALGGVKKKKSKKYPQDFTGDSSGGTFSINIKPLFPVFKNQVIQRENNYILLISSTLNWDAKYSHYITI